MNRPLRRLRPPPEGSAAAGSRNPAPQAEPGLPLPHRLAIAYLLLPVGVWLVGWFEWWFGVPAVALLCCGLRHTLGGGFREGRRTACEPPRHPRAGAAPAGPTPGNARTDARTPRPSAATAVAVAAALCWVMATAAGGFFDLQNGDWYEHRTMLLDLGRHPWPPYLPDHLAAYLPQRQDAAPALLRYYLGWHMVPGLAARQLGPAALDWAVPLWTWAGVALILALFARGCRGWEAAGAIAVLVFFGGMDLLRVAVLAGWDWIAPIVEGGAGREAFHWWRRASLPDLEPPMLALMWTPQHFIPAGLYALLCLHLRGRSRFLAASGVLLAAAPFWSAFVAVGLLPFVAVLLRENGLRPFLRWPNLLLAGPLAMLAASYLASGALDFPSGWLWEEIGRRKAAIRLPVLYVSEFALLALLLCMARPGLRREPFFIAGVATLLLLPLYRYGAANDLLKRGAMPALILLAWFCARTVVRQGGSILRTGGRRRLALSGLVAALAVGLLTPLTELARAFQRPGAFRHEQVAYTTLVDLPAQWRRQNVTRNVPPALRSLLRDPGRPAPRTARGELLSRSVFDVWLDDGKLIFVKARCTPSELERRFFVRSIPRDVDDLPAPPRKERLRPRPGLPAGSGRREMRVGRIAAGVSHRPPADGPADGGAGPLERGGGLRRQGAAPAAPARRCSAAATCRSGSRSAGPSAPRTPCSADDETPRMTGKPSPIPRVRPGLRRLLAAMLDRAPPLLLVVALMSAAFVGGMYVYKQKVFPYGLFRAAWLTGQKLFEIHVSESPLLHGATSVDVAPGRMEPLRFEFIGADALADPILVSGGATALSGYCPGATSCLAIEYAGRGEVVHAWPYRPDEIANAPGLADFPYEEPLGFRFSRHAYPVGASRYANGDLLVIFHLRHAFPYAGGVARIDRDGRVVWYRRDYSHHFPHLIDGDVALVPGLRIGEGPIRARYPTGRRRPVWTLHCDRPFLDFVRVVDGEGRLLEETSVFDALVESPYGRVLLHRSHPCDPTHLNYVHRVREDVGGVSGIEAGDLVVSLRNLNAFGILDRDDRRLKRLVRGAFFRQHSVTHLEGAKFLMFDNHGGNGVHGPSRLLLVDVAEGTERTVFPNDTTPGHLRDLFSAVGGHISVSPDRRRVVMVFPRDGRIVEVRLADGAVLAVLTKPYHPAPSGERKAGGWPYLHWLWGVQYVDGSGAGE